mgnify:CR=1 FL=1|tara:strand:- start:77 stop:418 length:342 start_codon:yes stop_codon:yes gene_type:complete
MAKRKNARVRKTDTSKWARPDPDTVKVTHVHTCLMIPSGKCPAKLEGDDRASVRDWLIEVTRVKPDNVTYQASVYKYWVRDFYDANSQEYKDVGALIDTIVTRKVSKIADIGE